MATVNVGSTHLPPESGAGENTDCENGGGGGGEDSDPNGGGAEHIPTKIAEFGGRHTRLLPEKLLQQECGKPIDA